MRCPKCGTQLSHTRTACSCGNRLSFKNIPAPPKRVGLVNDYEGILGGEHYEKIRKTLADFHKTTGIEIVIAILGNTKPHLPENYAYFLMNQWQPGGKDSTAFLILMAMYERRIETEISTGLERFITTQDTERILDDFVVPSIEESKYAEGLLAGIQEIIRVLNKLRAEMPVSPLETIAS